MFYILHTVMALFIHPDNQNILWEMIHKTPNLQKVFSKLNDNNYLNEWFKKHIENKYNQLPHNVTRNDLFKVNREVLSIMISDLNSMVISSNKPNTNATTLKIGSDYTNKSIEYNQLFDSQKPKEINFSEKLDDDIITNMDELIVKYRNERDYDLQIFGSQDKEKEPEKEPKKEPKKEVRFVSNEIIRSEEVLQNIHNLNLPLNNVQSNSSNSFSSVPHGDMLNEICKKMENMDKKINDLVLFVRELFPTNKEKELKETL